MGEADGKMISTQMIQWKHCLKSAILKNKRPETRVLFRKENGHIFLNTVKDFDRY